MLKFSIMGILLAGREQMRNRDVSHVLSSPGSPPTTFLSGEHAPRPGLHVTASGVSTRGRRRPASASRDNVTFGRRLSSLARSILRRTGAKLSRGWNYRRRLAPAVYGGQEIKCWPVTWFPTKKKRDRVAMVDRDRAALGNGTGHAIVETCELNNIWATKYHCAFENF